MKVLNRKGRGWTKQSGKNCETVIAAIFRQLYILQDIKENFPHF